MDLFSFLFLLIGVYVGYHVWRFRKLVRLGTKMAQNTIPFSRMLPGAAHRILVVGDSTGVGTGSVRPDDSVAGRLGRDFPTSELINMSKNGKRAKEQLADLLALDPGKIGTFDIVLVQIGGNDIASGPPFAETEETVGQMLDRAHAFGKLVLVMHTGNYGDSPIFQRLIGLYFTHRARAVRAIYKRIAPLHNAHYVDIFKERGQDIFMTDPKKYYGVDLYHPSGPGYGVWYEGVKKILVDQGAL